MRLDKNKLYVIPPVSKYFSDSLIDDYMDKDFTLNIICKINLKNLPLDTDSFIIARNGQHSGISVYVEENVNKYTNKKEIIPIIQYIYWAVDENGNGKLLKELFWLPLERQEKVNSYSMICKDDEKKIECYFNYIKVAEINYSGYEKVKYKNLFYWFGCGSMVSADNHKHIGDFDISLAFLLNKNIHIDEVKDISKHYKEKYVTKLNNTSNLKVLSDDCPHKNNFAFFCDFDVYSIYKIWNFVFNGINPCIYMENNTHY